MSVKLVTTQISTPGFYGLNSQMSSTGLDMSWATYADNLAFDEGGTLRTRHGWTSIPSAAFTTSDIITLGVYYKTTDSEYLIATANKKIFVSSTTTSAHDTWTDKTGTITTPTNNYWQFISHNGEVVGFQAAHAPCYYTGTGNFANLSAKSGYAAPDSSMTFGNCGLSAYGRVWTTDSTNTILLWSALGTNHQWSSASGGGFADLKITAVGWANGYDSITAIDVFQGNLVVFGKRSILIMAGADDPNNNLQIVDTITGMGCIARDTVEQTGSDVLFLDYTGIRSLKRAMLTQNVLLSDVSLNVRDELVANIASDSANGYKNLRGVFFPSKGFYLFIGSGGLMWVMDMKFPLDGFRARVTTWSGSGLNDAVALDKDMYLGLDGGYVGKYGGYDDNGATINFSYYSTWLDFNTSNLKIPKRLRVIFADGSGQTTNQCIAFDFKNSYKACFSKLVPYSGAGSEWNVDEWNVAEWSSGGKAYSAVSGCVGKHGHHVQVQIYGGYNSTANTTGLGIQSIELQVKTGGVAR